MRFPGQPTLLLVGCGLGEPGWLGNRLIRHSLHLDHSAAHMVVVEGLVFRHDVGCNLERVSIETKFSTIVTEQRVLGLTFDGREADVHDTHGLQLALRSLILARRCNRDSGHGIVGMIGLHSEQRFGPWGFLCDGDRFRILFFFFRPASSSPSNAQTCWTIVTNPTLILLLCPPTKVASRMRGGNMEDMVASPPAWCPCMVELIHDHAYIHIPISPPNMMKRQ